MTVPDLNLVGTSTVRYQASVASIPLPSGTRAGDLIVVSAVASDNYEVFSMSDDRLTQEVADVGPFKGGIWTGPADNSGDPIGLTMTNTGAAWAPYSCAVVAVFRNRKVGDVETVVGVASPTIQSVPYRGAIAAQFSGYSVVDGAASLPSGWTAAVSPTTGKAHASIIYWTGEAPSPSVTWSMTGSVEADRCGMAVFGARPKTTVAPPCRLFPREDGLGVGGGRHFPPPKSQQRGLRRGPGSYY